jgi:protein-disulfide isomerase-like protein with CxxC motif
MIHECPLCSWRYGHAPDCPFTRAPAESTENAVWLLVIGLVAECIFLGVLR